MNEEKKPEEKKGGKKFFWIAVAIGVIVILAVVAWVMMSDNGHYDGQSPDLRGFFNKQSTEEQSEEDTTAALLTFKQGTVEAKLVDNEWKKVTVDMSLGEGSKLRTGKSSKTVLDLSDGSTLRLDAESEIELTELGEKKTVITQIKGTTYHRGNHESGSEYQLKSLDTTVIPEGTAFQVVTDLEEETVEVLVLQSKVKVALWKDGKLVEEKELKEGKSLAVKKEAWNERAVSTKELQGDDWYSWNKEEDEKKKGTELGILEDLDKKEEPVAEKETEEKKEEEVVAPVEPETGLTLQAQVSVGKVSLSWSSTSLSADNFKYYKVVRSETNANLKYPDDGYISVISQKDTLSHADTEAVGGKSYYYRICAVDKNSLVRCGNVKQVTAEAAVVEDTPKEEGSTSVSATVSASGVSLAWNQASGENFSYYKVVRSKTNSDLKYPDDGYIYYSTDISQLSYVDADVTAATQGTYYYRICVVKGEGATITCSNVITVENGVVK